MIDVTSLSDEEYKRLQQRLKVKRYRKRKKAIAEGKEPDFYILDEDYIDGYGDEVSSIPSPSPVVVSPIKKKHVVTSRPQDDDEVTPINGWVLGGIVAGVIGFVIALPIYIAKRLQ